MTIHQAMAVIWLSLFRSCEIKFNSLTDNLKASVTLVFKLLDCTMLKKFLTVSVPFNEIGNSILENGSSGPILGKMISQATLIFHLGSPEGKENFSLKKNNKIAYFSVDLLIGLPCLHL